MTSFVPDLPDPAASRAVLMGVSGYRNLPPVPAAAANVSDLARILTDPALLGLAAEHVVTLGDTDVAGTGGVTAAIDSVRDVAQKATDALIVYFAGHGLRGEYGSDELYLALPDTTPEERFHTALRFTWLRWAMRDSRAARKIIVLDTCFSGLALDVPITAVRHGMARLGDGVAMLASSPSTRPSRAVEGAKHTAFTGELLDILDDGVGGGPALLDLETIYQQLFVAFEDGRITEPQLSSRGLGARIALVRNRHYRPGAMVPAPVPGDLSRLVEALEPVADLAPTVTGPLLADYQIVAEGLALIRSGDEIETGPMFRVLASLARIAEVLARLSQEPPDHLSHLVGSSRGGDPHSDLVRDFLDAIEAEIRHARDAAIAAIPELAADLEPRRVTIGFWAQPTLTRALFDDLAQQLAYEFERTLLSEVQRRIGPLASRFAEGLADIEFTGTGYDIVPQASLRQAYFARVAETLRRSAGMPPALGVTYWLRPVSDPSVPLLGLALIHGPAQIAYVRGLVTAATARSLTEAVRAAEQNEQLLRQAEEWAENVLSLLDQERVALLEPQRIAAGQAEHARQVIREILESGS